MFSEAGWLVEQLQRLHDDDCADAWRVWRLQELADYCRRSPMPTQQVRAFAEFLEPPYSTEVHRTAAECIRLLLSSVLPPSTTVKGTVEWLDGNMAVVRFEHPSVGVVEREFDRKALPEGTEGGDSFDLEIELDASGRVCSYRPRLHSLEKRGPREWEIIPKPPAPTNLDDPEEMARYEAAMDEYMARTTAIRAQNAARWKAARKKR